MPGCRMKGAAIYELIETEGVTFSAAVATIWQMLLQHLIETRAPLTSLKRVVIGMPHPKWDERPLLLIQLKAGER